ncbi:MAG: MATE family efflux transporter [Alphaproteobacteria bacterium]|nr:MATE family efflux transporter [Alphaproteobacteria bacterium]MCZ6763636.1 MATE family efflux transporter [Alphaproteobacteria bacterium]
MNPASYVGQKIGFHRVWRLAWPVIISGLSVPLLGAADTAVMGHLPDPAFIGAVAVGAMIFSFLYWGFGFLRMGTTGFTAQALGASDDEEIRDTLIRSLLLGLVLAALLYALQFPAAWLAFGVLDAEPVVETLARRYFDIRIWGAPATLANYAVLGWLVGIQRPGIALVIQVATNSLNIALDLVLVIGLGLDVDGVALATVAAEACGAVLGLVIVARIWPRAGGKGSDRIWNWRRIADRRRVIAMLRVNRDFFLRTLCIIFAFATFTAKGAALGTTVLAANAVLMIFQQFLAYGLDGFAHAAEALVGNAKGARNRQAFRDAVRSSTLLAVAVACGYTVAYVLLAKPIVYILTDLDEVRREAGYYLFWLYISPLVSVWSYQLDGIFIGTTRSREMRNGMVISLAVFLGLMAILPGIWGVHGMWIALLGFMATRAVTLGFWLPRIDRAMARS